MNAVWDGWVESISVSYLETSPNQSPFTTMLYCWSEFQLICCAWSHMIFLNYSQLISLLNIKTRLFVMNTFSLFHSYQTGWTFHYWVNCEFTINKNMFQIIILYINYAHTDIKMICSNSMVQSCCHLFYYHFHRSPVAHPLLGTLITGLSVFHSEFWVYSV